MLFEEYRCCRLCPRDCSVDRTAGTRGRCGETATCRIASAEPHFGEEPPISGTRGSGTIFFSGCSSRCFFCQNHQISSGGHGMPVDFDDLVQVASRLILLGVHNLNFVTPDHFWPHIRALAQALRAKGHTIPLLFNGSGYVWPERVDDYAEHMDIFMPDFKFASADIAAACMGDARYPDLAMAAITKMVAHRGFLDPWDLSGLRPATRGVLVRHLVLPGEVENSLEALRRLRKEFGPLLPLSLMSQFHPVLGCHEKQMLTRRLRADEYRQVCDFAGELGFRNVFLQQSPDPSEFLPDFFNPHPFRGNRR